MIKEQLEQWLTRHGYSRDKFGHYQKENDCGRYRYKLSSISVRYERQANIVDHNEWLRIASGYYKNLSLTQDDKLAGLKR